MKKNIAFILFLSAISAAGCALQPLTPSTGHIMDQPSAATGKIPEPVRQTVTLPPPSPRPKAEKYSVVVNNVPVQELLFALARDAKINVDVHADIKGMVTLNAIDQTLPQLLTRIAKQVDMRYELDGQTLLVQPDSPYLKIYKIDYVNITRDSKTTVNIATQIATTGSSPVGGSSSSSGDNNSLSNIISISNNRFWPTMIANIQDILRETDKIIPDTKSGGQPLNENAGVSTAELQPDTSGMKNDSPQALKTTYREAASVIANPENGIISVRATSRQHESVQEFLTNVLNAAKRQVLIEATVIEVQLSDKYQQGIDWQILSNNSDGFNLVHLPQGSSPLSTGATPGATYPGPILSNGKPIFGSGGPATMLLNYTSANLFGYNVAATISLLESFGNVKVLSSPKISVLNNQTALLKVVDNKVYFTIDVSLTRNKDGDITDKTFTSKVHTVPVGFVMGVTPQIDEANTVTLNVRPTISRITGYVSDPNPALAEVNVTSLIPEIQTREMESILKIHDGQVAVMGGLMQDTLNKKTDGVPVLSRLPVIGNAFSYINDVSNKSELVIFLRPVVVKNLIASGEYEKFQNFLPDKTFFNDRPGQTKFDPFTVNPIGATD
jgi:general secretion pathway protein D